MQQQPLVELSENIASRGGRSREWNTYYNTHSEQKQIAPADPEVTASCRKTRKFGEAYYIVEAALVHDGRLLVYANHMETAETIMAEISAEKCMR